MLEIEPKAIDRLEDIAQYGTDDCKYHECRCCILSHFDNAKCSCQENAKNLLKVLAHKDAILQPTYPKMYAESTLKGMSKNQLVELVKCLQHNFMVDEDCINHQIKVLTDFMDDKKGELSIKLEWKDKNGNR